MAGKKSDRCWPGYEPVPGKAEHSQGSCRPKAESKSTPSERQFKAKRRKQLDEWQSKHPGSRRQSAQHLSAPSTTPKTAGKKAKPTKKSATGTKTGSKKTASTNSSAKTSTAKKSTARKATSKRSARKAAAPSPRKAA